MRRGVFRGWPVRPDVVEQAEAVEQPTVADPTAVTIEDRRLAGPPPGAPLESPPDRQLWPWLLVLLVLVAAGIAVVYFATRDDTNPQGQAATAAQLRSTTSTAGSTAPTVTRARAVSAPARVTVPKLVGLTAPTALTRLRQLGLAGTTRNVFSTKPANVVVAQAPGWSRRVTKGGTVTLTVSKGPETASIPDLVGQQVTDALGTLRAEALKFRVFRVPSAEAAGQVVAQAPQAGTKARPGASVRLNVADGKQPTTTSKHNAPTGKTSATSPVTTTEQNPPTSTKPAGVNPLVQVPDLDGKSLLDARRLARRVGLVMEIRRVPNAQPLGTVIAQAKPPGTEVKRGTHLLITVSQGRKAPASSTPSPGSQKVVIPDVTGEDEVTATEDLEDAGFTVHAVDRDTEDASQDGIVIQQTPEGNQSGQTSSTVTIYVGRYTGA